MTGRASPASTPGVVKALVVGYPLLGLVYLTDRLGTLVEPIFFIAFSVMVLTEVFEPIGRGTASPSWADGPYPVDHERWRWTRTRRLPAPRAGGRGAPGSTAVDGELPFGAVGRGGAPSVENGRSQRGPPFAPRVRGHRPNHAGRCM